jgi:multiple antibiotic resistance protein
MEIPATFDLLAFATIAFNLFLIIDPVGCLPLFIAITKDNTKKERRAMVRKAVLIAFFVLVFFAIVGHPLLSYFQITTPAMRIAGGVLLFIIGIEMLYGRVSRTETTEKEEEEAAEKEDVSITPLAIPLLAGPGAITVVMLFSGTGKGGVMGALLVILALLLVLASSWLLLSASETIMEVMGTLGIRVTARVMGLLLIFMASQFVIDGLTALGLVKVPVI